MPQSSLGQKVRDRRELLKLSQEKLADLAKTTQSTINRIETNGFKRMPSALPRIATVLGLELKELDDTLNGKQIWAPAVPSGPIGERDMPLYATAEGGDGALVLSSDPVDIVRRPEPLLNVRGGYGVIVTGELMIPVFRPGDIALVNPHLPPRADEEVVLQSQREGEVSAIIKTFLRATATEYRLRQWNPQGDLSRSKKEWPTCHLVIGKYSRR